MSSPLMSDYIEEEDDRQLRLMEKEQELQARWKTEPERDALAAWEQTDAA